MLINFQHTLILAKSRAWPAIRKGHRGFTLVEAMIVVSIVAILIVGVAPAYTQWNRNRQLFQQANDLFSHMHSAKLAAVRNNCNVVISFVPPNSYQVFRDDGGTANVGANNDLRDATEAIIVSHTLPNNISMLIDGAQFSGTTTPGFTARALPLQGRIGNVVFRRNGESVRWYRVALGPSGLVNLQVSTDSTDGTDGTWGDI